MVKKSIKAVASKIIERVKASQAENAENPPWVKQVAMLTGLLAAMSGFLAVRSATLTNDAIYQSNQAILAQAQASDSWSEYQADSIKARIDETQLTVARGIDPTSRGKLTDDAADLRGRQPAIKETAIEKERERDDHLKDGLKRLAEKDLLGYSDMASQLGIALASVAALVRVRSAFHIGIAVGVLAIAITAYAFAVHYGIVAQV